MDYYEILGVEKDADTDEIRTAYRKLVRTYHPDYSGESDAVEFRQIQEAYEVLSDPEARTAYDERLGTEVPVRIVSRREPAYEERPFVRHEVSPRWQRRTSQVSEDPFEEFFSLLRRFFGPF